jgi:hypothetical protein
MINIIWQTFSSDNQVIHNETLCQFEYITKVLFKNIEFKNYFDNKEYKTVLNNSIIIYSAWNKYIDNEQKEYFNKFKNNGFNYILFHLSNEFLDHYHDYYSDANFVFRFHFDPDIKLSNVFTFPMGFLSGYLNNDNNINLSKDRNLLVTFVGDLKHDRRIMIDNISNIENKFIHCTNTWGASNMLSFKDVIEVYKKTLFVPIPLGYGNRDETCRPYEALEYGCIPILKKVNGVDFYKSVLGEHPLPSVNEWSELKPLMEKLSTEKIDDLIIKIHNWYLNLKDELSKKASDIINKNLI